MNPLYPFHYARERVRAIANHEPTVAEATQVLRAYCAEKGLEELAVAQVLADAQLAGRHLATSYEIALVDRADALRWTDVAPTKPGIYRWRKDRKWEPVERVVRRNPAGVLIIFSHRLENWVPLNFVEAGGSQWDKTSFSS